MLLSQSTVVGQSIIKDRLKNAAELGAGYTRAQGDSSIALATYVGSIVRIALVSVGILFFALLAYAGYLWMTAGGNDDDIKKATKILTRASIGLILTVLAGAITQFVLFYAER